MASPGMSPPPTKRRCENPPLRSVQEIYNPLLELKFQATYIEQRESSRKAVLQVKSPAHFKELLESICQQLEGVPIWKGIWKERGEYKLYVDDNQKLNCNKKLYSCKIVAIDIQPTDSATSKYQGFVNITIEVESTCPTDPGLTHRLEEEIKSIYKPLTNVVFMATYMERRLIEATGYYRDKWEVSSNSNEMTAALQRIIDTINTKEFEGYEMDKIVWRGITPDLESSAFVLWVCPSDEEVETYKRGCIYECSITSIKVFKDLSKWKKPYKAGVNILICAEERVEHESEDDDVEESSSTDVSSASEED